jgi:hypothetical protein
MSGGDHPDIQWAYRLGELVTCDLDRPNEQIYVVVKRRINGARATDGTDANYEQYDLAIGREISWEKVHHSHLKAVPLKEQPHG